MKSCRLPIVAVFAFFVALAAVVRAETPPAPLRVLFLGNSLTERNNLPALVQAMAKLGGIPVDCEAVTLPDYAIEDHWNDGTARLLAERKRDVLVLQQGPSSRPESRVHLQFWSQKWADEARRHGTQPALYMVWPYQNQRDGFRLVADSYRNAATVTHAKIFPAGEAWDAILRSEKSIRLYDSDGLHPTVEGSFLAAMVIARGLTGLDPALVPAKLTLASGRTVELPESTVAAFRRVVAQARLD